MRLDLAKGGCFPSTLGKKGHFQEAARRLKGPPFAPLKVPWEDPLLLSPTPVHAT